jgi:hypothetical protein
VSDDAADGGHRVWETHARVGDWAARRAGQYYSVANDPIGHMGITKLWSYEMAIESHSALEKSLRPSANAEAQNSQCKLGKVEPMPKINELCDLRHRPSSRYFS